MQKRILLIVLALTIAISIGFYFIQEWSMNQCAENFIVNLAENMDPERYCTGEALYRVKTRGISKAKIESISTTTIDYSGKYGRVYVEVEMILPDKADEVSFYELDLVKNGSWKVYSVRETLPKITSLGYPGKGPVDEIDSVYREYFNQICEGNSFLLSGPARTAYEKQPEKTTFKNTMVGLQTKVVYHGGKKVIAQHNYKFDGRSVKVLIHYYLTRQGYKIVSIAAI